MIRINLLPTPAGKKPEKAVDVGESKFIIIKLILPLVLSLLLAGGVFAYMEMTKSSLKEDIEKNKKIYAQLQQKIEEVKKFEFMNKEIEMKTKLIENLKKKQQEPLTILRGVAKSLPEGVWLTELSYGVTQKTQSAPPQDRDTQKPSDKKIIIKGVGFSNLNIVAFVEAIKKSPEFINVNLLETSQSEYEKIPVYKFALEFSLKD